MSDYALSNDRERIAEFARHHGIPFWQAEMALAVDPALMRDLMKDSHYNPNRVERRGLVTVAGAGVVQNGVALASGEPMPSGPGEGHNWGYQLEASKELSRNDQALIAKLCDQHLGPVNRAPTLKDASVEQLHEALTLARRYPLSREIEAFIAAAEGEIKGRGLGDGQSLPTAQVEGADERGRDGRDGPR